MLFSIDAHAGRSVLDDPLQKYRFRISIPNYPNTAGFSKCSAFIDEVDVIEYCEGIWGYTHRIPGRSKVEPITLERGAYSDLNGYYALKETRTNPNMRGDITLVVGRSQSESQNIGVSSEAFTIQLAEAWVSKVEMGDWDATSGDILIEKMTVQYEYMMDNSAFTVIDGSSSNNWFSFATSGGASSSEEGEP